VVDIAIRAKPSHAQIKIDDAVVSGNPFTGKYREDGVMHRVRVTAQGFEPVIRDVPFSGNVTLDIDLARIAAAPVPARPVALRRKQPAARFELPPPSAPPVVQPPPVPKSDPSQINPNGGQKPRRTIDSNNPYNQ
jgi:eukaryotic-like serine/threonine-protein kinase